MKQILNIMVVWLLLTIGVMPITAKNPRSIGNVAMTSGYRLPLNKQQRATILAVQPETGKTGFSSVARLDKGETFRHPQKLSPSGATLQGLQVDLLSGDSYWSELYTDGAVRTLWKTPSEFINSGFIRNGEIYGFSSTAFMGYAFLGHGVFSLSGETLKWIDDDDYFEDFSRYVFQCCYDAVADTAYAYTLNSDATAYMFQSIEPESSVFTVINDNIPLEDVCVGLTWNAHDGKLYGYTSDRRICEVDRSSGELSTLVCLNNYDVSTSCQGFVYSPLDKAFFLVVTSGSSDASPVVKINPIDWSYEEVASLNYTRFPILVCDDEPLADNAPLAPVVEEFGFEGGSLQGSAGIVFPSEDFSGMPLVGTLNICVDIDGSEYGKYEGTPGEKLTIDLDVNEGEHCFSFYAQTVDGLTGPKIEKECYVGFDEPIAPQDIVLEEGKVTWMAVTSGVHSGYIDVQNICYYVYLNDELLTEAPISATEYVFTMPEVEYGVQRAAVVAVNAGKLSAKGYSNQIKAGSAYPLPFTVVPTEDELMLLEFIDANDDLYGWERYLSYDDALECGTYSYRESDDWLMLPPVIFESSENLYRIAFDVKTGDSTANDILEVAIGEDMTISSMAIIGRFEKFSDKEFERVEVYYYSDRSWEPVIALHAVTPGDGGGLYVKNIEISHTDVSSDCPVEPVIKNVVAASMGKLTAEVEVEAPSLNVRGEILPAGKQLSLVVKSEVDEKTIEVTPGSVISTTLSTLQGFNEIEVFASLEGNKGFVATSNVFTGLDVPMPISDPVVSTGVDNLSVNLSWETPTAGINGGYVDPAKVEYYLCELNEDGDWEIVDNIGSKTNYTINFTSATPLHIYYCGIVCGNDIDLNPAIKVVRVMAGKPLGLPLEETFDDYEVHAGPHMTLNPTSDYTASWSGGSNEWMEVASTGESYTCSADWRTDYSKGLLMLPKFSTVGLKNVVLDLMSLYHSSMGSLNIYAYLPGEEAEVVGKIAPEDFDVAEWKTQRFILNEKYLGKACVGILLEPEFTSTDMFDVIDGYVVRGVEEEEFLITSFDATPFVKVGDGFKAVVTVENIGLNPSVSPEMTLSVVKDGEVVQTVEMISINGDGMVEPLTSISYECEVTTDVNALGKLDLECRAKNYSGCEGNVIIEVYKDNEVVIDDLMAVLEDDNVTLKWTEHEFKGVEDFENMAAWCFPSTIGDFKNVDNDGNADNYFSHFSFPFDRTPKAFQIFSEEEFDILLKEVFPDEDNFMLAYSDDKFAVSVTAFGDETDDWLISPLLKGGSKFSFVASDVDGYRENVEILYSSGDGSLDSFEVIDSFTIMSAGWKSYEYIVPEKDGYIAIRHSGGDFALCIDDIAYSPVSQNFVDSYKIVRNGVCIDPVAAASGIWIDSDIPSERLLEYYIVPVSGGSEGQKSNVAAIQFSAIEEAIADVKIYSVKNTIVVEGHDHDRLRIWRTDGIMILDEQVVGDCRRVDAPAGIYIVEVGESTAKISVN